MARMGALEFAALLIAAFFGGIITCAIVQYLYASSDSLGASRWRDALATQLDQHGSVRLADLVPFKWDKVYVVGPYELGDESKLAVDIWGREAGTWWDTDERYWTVIYRRPGSSPFLVKMERSRWRNVGRRYASDDQGATLVSVKRADNPGCSPDIRYCIMLTQGAANP